MTLDLRDRYFVPENAVELRAFTHGLMPRTVPAMLQHFVDDWKRLGVDAWNEVPNHWLPDSGDRIGWWNLPEYLGDRFVAPLLGAAQGTCILQPNVHWSVGSLLSDPDRFRGGRVVVASDAFPSVLQTAKRWASPSGYHLDLAAPAGLEAAVANADCDLLVFSHVAFMTGSCLTDELIKRLVRRVHRRNGLVAVDGYHAACSMGVDVEALGVDAYFGGLLKEGSGASGNAFLYLRAGLEIDPLLTGWFGHEDPFAFEREPQPCPDVRRRFLGGTSAVAPCYHAVEGLRILLQVGLDVVRQDSLEKTAYCLARADAANLSVRSPRADDQRGAMVILELDAADRLCETLKWRGIFTDSRVGRYLRMAPFVWNTVEELDRTWNAIESLVQSGEYLEVEPRRGAGPVT